MTTQKRARSVVRESPHSWMYRLRRHVAKSLGNCRQVATRSFSTARQGVETRATRRCSNSGATTSTRDERVHRDCSDGLSFHEPAYPHTIHPPHPRALTIDIFH